MFTFNHDSLFFINHAELVLQFEQTESVLKQRLERGAEDNKLIETLKANLLAQGYSLFKYALAKEGENYLYADILAANLDAFTTNFCQTDKHVFPSKKNDNLYSSKYHALAIKAFKEHTEKLQAKLFQHIHTQSITKELIIQSCINLSTFHANKKDSKISLYKYDSLLHYAARIGNVEAITLLLEMGADINGYKPSYKYTDKANATINTTPLGVAIASDNTRAATALLSAGARIDMKEFPNKSYYQNITSQIKSADMRELLMEYAHIQIQQASQTADDTSFTFTEQMLLAENKHLKSELALLNSKLDAVLASLKPANSHQAYQGPALFDLPYQPAQSEQHDGEPDLKRHKIMLDVD